MQAAVAYGQLKRLPELLKFKRTAFGWYQKSISRIFRASRSIPNCRAP